MPEQSNGFFHSPFWNSWWGKITALFALFFIMPTDEVFRDNVAPAWTNAKKRLRNGWGHASEAMRAAGHWLAGKGHQLLWMTVLMLVISFTFIAVGLSFHNPVPVAVGGLLWTGYAVIVWLIMKASLKAGAALADGGMSTAHAVFAKVGLARPYGDGFSVDRAGIGRFVDKTFAVIPAGAAGCFLLTQLPHWLALGVLLVLALGAMTIASISAYIGDSTVDGWRLVKQGTFVLMLINVALLVLRLYLPETFRTYVDAKGMDSWLADPSWSVGWVGTLAAIAVGATALWVVAGRFSGEAGRRFSKLIFPAAAIGMVLVFVFMGPFASKVEGATEAYTDDAISGQARGSSRASNDDRETYPSFDGSNAATMDAPDDVEYVSIDRSRGRRRASREASPERTREGSDPKVPQAKPGPAVTVKTSPEGDGYDEATALLDEMEF